MTRLLPVVLILLASAEAQAYEAYGRIVAASEVWTSNASYSVSFVAGLPVIGGGSSGDYRVDPILWTQSGSGVDVPEPSPAPPAADCLYQNRPNPFGTATRIAFDVGGVTGGIKRARLDIFDIHGRLVKTILNGSFAPGRHQATWEGIGTNGQRVPNGVYLAQFRSTSISRTIRVVVVR